MSESIYTAARNRMVDEQLSERDIRDPRVLDALRTVPRELFVPAEYRHLAYADGPLPIGNDQTISQPYIVALMTQLLELHGDEKVMEIGTGSGYQAAVLSHLAREVHSIERFEVLARQAEDLLRRIGVNNVFIHVGDGTMGLPELAPFDAITVTAAAPVVPPPLLEQLADGGRLVIPVGGRGGQTLERWRRAGADFESQAISPVAFVPLLGAFGWRP